MSFDDKPNDAPDPTNPTARKKARFLKELREHGTVLHAAKAANIDRSTVYEWRDKDKAFALEWIASQDMCVEAMEKSLYKRGIEGDNTAAIFWLKGNAPDKYREKIEVNGEKLTDSEINARLSELLGKAKAALPHDGEKPQK